MMLPRFVCEICQCNVFALEESYKLINHPKYGNMNLCPLCAASAEKLGWRIEVMN